jgi:dihydroorotate dehydrogenase (NAD+) catalytic subunit
MVAAVGGAVSLPVWVKLTGQSERVPDLVQASFDGGAAAVIVAGRLLGLIPDVETMLPALGTSLGIGGYWNLPLTCHWLALSRARMGPERPMIGVNGAQSGLDVARMMLAGAHAVEIASAAMLRGINVLAEAVAELERYLDRKGIDACDLIGRAADARRSFASLPPLPDNWKRYVPESPTTERPTQSETLSSRSR